MSVTNIIFLHGIGLNGNTAQRRGQRLKWDIYIYDPQRIPIYVCMYGCMYYPCHTMLQ